MKEMKLYFKSGTAPFPLTFVFESLRSRRDLFKRRASARLSAPSSENSTPKRSTITRPMFTLRALASKDSPISPRRFYPRLRHLRYGLTLRVWQNFFMSLPVNRHLLRERTFNCLEEERMVPRASAPLNDCYNTEQHLPFP